MKNAFPPQGEINRQLFNYMILHIAFGMQDQPLCSEQTNTLNDPHRRTQS